MTDTNNKSKADLIAERQANLPLPDDPPRPSDWNSMDASINVKAGERQDDMKFASDSTGLRDPATAESAVRSDGETYKENVAGLGRGRAAEEGLGGLPSDAVTKEARGKPGVVETRGKDYGYPEKNDPSNGQL